MREAKTHNNNTNAGNNNGIVNHSHDTRKMNTEEEAGLGES